MDERLLDLYEIELRHLQQMLQEYRAGHEKIGARLLIDQDGRCQDPWVQRLLEGFAFLAARVHRRLDDEFPRFTQALIESTHPDFLCPVPSMGIFEFRPESSVPDLMAGREVPRGTSIRNKVEGREGAAPVCEFRTAHPVRLFSLLLGRIRYVTRELDALSLPPPVAAGAKSALVLGLTNKAPAPISQVKASQLDVYVAASGDARSQLVELLMGHCQGVCVRNPERPGEGCLSAGDAGGVSQLGLSEEESLLPLDRRTFSGFRLLREYLCLPERTQFYRISGFSAGLELCSGREADLLLVFDKEFPQLARLIDEQSSGGDRPVEAVKLYCTPAVNLFPMSFNRIPLDQGASELHLVADRFRPLHHEIYRIESVEGLGDLGQRQPFRPFFEVNDQTGRRGNPTGNAFYTIRRTARGPTQQEEDAGAMRSYAGTEVYMTLVDAANAPYHPDLRQLKVDCLCSNRHLPREIPSEVWHGDLVASPSPAYLRQVVPLGQVTEPQMPEIEGQSAWRFISHLGLNLGSVAAADDSPASGAWLREVLRLHAPPTARAAHEQIEGLVSVRVRPVVRRLEGSAPAAFVRGHEVRLDVDEDAFHGHSAVLFGAVIARFLARHVAMNSFVETVLWSIPRKQETMRWTARPGLRSVV